MDKKDIDNQYNEEMLNSLILEDEDLSGIPAAGEYFILKDDTITEKKLQKILKKMEERDRKLAEDIIAILNERDERELKAKEKEAKRLSKLDYYEFNPKKEDKTMRKRLSKDQKEELLAVKKLAQLLDKYDSKRCKH